MGQRLQPLSPAGATASSPISSARACSSTRRVLDAAAARHRDSARSMRQTSIRFADTARRAAAASARRRPAAAGRRRPRRREPVRREVVAKAFRGAEILYTLQLRQRRHGALAGAVAPQPRDRRAHRHSARARPRHRLRAAARASCPLIAPTTASPNRRQLQGQAPAGAGPLRRDRLGASAPRRRIRVTGRRDPAPEGPPLTSGRCEAGTVSRSRRAPDGSSASRVRGVARRSP